MDYHPPSIDMGNTCIDRNVKSKQESGVGCHEEERVKIPAFDVMVAFNPHDLTPADGGAVPRRTLISVEDYLSQAYLSSRAANEGSGSQIFWQVRCFVCKILSGFFFPPKIGKNARCSTRPLPGSQSSVM